MLILLKEKGFDSPRNGFGEDENTLPDLKPLLKHCLGQLESQSDFARELLDCVAICADEGIELRFFIDWQAKDIQPEQVKHELTIANNLGLLLVEEVVSSFIDEEHTAINIRLHTDLLNLLRESDLEPERDSLQKYLYETLVISTGEMETKRGLQKQIVALQDYYQGDKDRLVLLYSNFWIHLYNTSRLYWAFSIGEAVLNLLDTENNAKNYAAIIGNQALILQDWGKFEDAMELHKKEEAIKVEKNQINTIPLVSYA